MYVARSRPVVMALRGLGDAAAAVPGFSDGLMAWKSPGDAIAAITATKSADIPDRLPYLGGLLAVPLGVAVVAMQMMGGRRRR